MKGRTFDAKYLEGGSNQIDFKSLLITDELVRGLSECGFLHPSPVQAKSIPVAVSGLDLIVQAKSGTGKTCVFGVSVLQRYIANQDFKGGIFAVILSPTREIALQTKNVIEKIGKYVPGLHVHAAIGGVDPAFDYSLVNTCQILVATPGRLKALISEKILKIENLEMFVLDEADELLSEKFQKDVEPIVENLPQKRQNLCFSASYPPPVYNRVKDMMNNAEEVLVSPSVQTLVGVREYFWRIDTDDQRKAQVLKMKKLVEILSSLDYDQSIVFCNSFLTAKRVSSSLNNKGLPSVFIYGKMKQAMRTSVLQSFKDYSSRILVSTDLTARGVDLTRVNLIVNMDLSDSPETHLHRSGRTGRFGTYGVVISLVSGEGESSLMEFAKYYKCSIHELPAQLLSIQELLEGGDEDQDDMLGKENEEADVVEGNKDDMYLKVREQFSKARKTVIDVPDAGSGETRSISHKRKRSNHFYSEKGGSKNRISEGNCIYCGGYLTLRKI